MKGQIGFMKGIEFAKTFYEDSVMPLIHSDFSEYEHRIAVGLVGQGSECFGFDDQISQDHDFGRRLFLWVTKEDYQKIGIALSESYQKLSGKNNIAADRGGVFTIDEFYGRLIGCPSAPLSNNEWMRIPEYALATAVNGAVFRDDLGAFSLIRSELSKGFPRDVALKKIAAHLALMAQAGQYNFPRMLSRGDEAAASLALYEFINHGLHVLFLLNDRYTPFYKWRFRASRELPLLKNIAFDLENLAKDKISAATINQIENIAQKIMVDLNRRGLSNSGEPFLEAQAIAITEKIQDPALQRLHLMEFGAE